LPALYFEKGLEDIAGEARSIADGTNVARHLVNVPGGELNPHTYADFIRTLFADAKNANVTVMDTDTLINQGMGLLTGVGRGSEFTSQLVHISYRPGGTKEKDRPIAFIGKGVTFDTGGLDMKQSQFMRLMKKDMGGSASIVGLAWWVVTSEWNRPCDFYLALAENSVDALAIRPGDILEAMNGRTVEIHNTDAEGRLVMADAMVLAAQKEGKDRPIAIIDAATLTGAMRVALGTKVAGLLANNDPLAEAILRAGAQVGDPCWRVPLVREYRELLKSTVADMANCSSSPYAGGITAALFLEEFIPKGMPWAHLDMMAWAEKPAGAVGEPGGNGQMVQALAQFLRDFDPRSLTR
jgi:leucyl aminopeptidase